MAERTLADAQDSDIGFVLLKSVVRLASWVPRRVERMELLDDVTARRMTRLDIDLAGLLVNPATVELGDPGLEFAGAFPLWRGNVLVALVIVNRNSYTSFEVTREDGLPLPRFTRSEERRFVSAGLICLAEQVLGQTLSRATASAIDGLVKGSPGLSAADIKENLRDGRQGCQLVRDENFIDILMLVVANYLLVVVPDLGAGGATVGQVAWLDARHRSHVHVEADVKQAKAIGMNRWPSRHWKVNVAWLAVVAMAGSPLAAFRHLGLPDGDLRKASIQTLRFRLFEVPGRITYGQRKTWLHLPTDWPWTHVPTTAWRTIKTLLIPT